MILPIACELPENSGRPIDVWTGRELADEVVGRGILDSISTSQVNRYLRETELQPHRHKYWLNTTEKDPERFEQQVQTVCNGYLEAPEWYTQCNTHTVCVDEMTGIQAIERNAKTLPMQPGRAARIEFEYTRHGTLCFFGAWHVVIGQMIQPTIRKTRTEEDFRWHIHHTIAWDSQAGWVLKSMASRQEFLSDRSHRIRFVYLPKHSSWLNQIEIVFGIVSRRVLRRGNYSSVEALRQRLLEFIDYFNRTFAQPFRWTYTGRPVSATPVQRPVTWKERWAKKS